MRVAQQFGRNLVQARRSAGLSQEQLAFLADLHRTEIGMLERGTRLARIDSLIKLCGALEIRPDELLDGVEWQPGTPQLGQFRERGR